MDGGIGVINGNAGFREQCAVVDFPIPIEPVSPRTIMSDTQQMLAAQKCQ